MVDWSLLACGRSGHVTYAPDEPELREQLSIATAAGAAWQCLRCAAYVAGPPGGSGPASDAPTVRRGKEVRSAVILRVFAVERFLRAVVFLALAYGLWRFKYARQSIDATFDRERPIIRELFRQLGYNIDNSKLVGLIQHALTLSGRSITLLAVGLAAYAVVELVEGVGLWLTRRWGEYFAMLATSAGLPLEIYDLTNKVTVTTLVFLAINLALVVYLVLTKRLLGIRGGRQAYEARLRSDSVLEAAIEAAAAARDPHSPAPDDSLPATSPTSGDSAASVASAASGDEADLQSAADLQAAVDLQSAAGPESAARAARTPS